MATKCCLQAFQLARLQIVRSLNAQIEIGMLSDSSDEVTLKGLVDDIAMLGNASMLVNYTSTLANPDAVAYAFSKGVGWASYTVNDTGVALSLKEIGVVRVISDYPITLP